MSYLFAGEDDETFKIQHPDGSTFSIAKNAVGPGVHKRIKDLKPLKMAEGGEVPDFEQNPSPLSAPGEPPLFDATQAQPLAIEPMGSVVPQPQNPLIIEPVASVQRAPSQILPEQPVQPAIDQNVPGLPGLAPSQEKAFKTQESAIKNIAATQAKTYQDISKVQADQAEQAKLLDAELKRTTAPLEAENQNLFNDIRSAKIDPNRLWGNMSTGNKVLAAISIGLSGLGQGLQGHGARNMALDVIDKSIDRDIEAQMAELGKKQTLFSDNLRRLGDARYAAAATKMQMLTITQAQISSMMAKSQSQEALQRGEMGLAQIQLQKDALKNQMGIRDMARRGGAADPAVFVPHLVPKERQAEVFKEIKDAQNIKKGAADGLHAFDEAAKEQTVFSKNVIPGVNSPFVGQLKASVLPQFQNIDGTVRQAAMDAFLPTITPAVGDSKHTIEQKRKTLADWYVAHSSAPTAKGYGIDLDRFGSTTTEQPPEAEERFDPASGRVAIFDKKTKNFLRYK